MSRATWLQHVSGRWHWAPRAPSAVCGATVSPAIKRSRSGPAHIGAKVCRRCHKRWRLHLQKRRRDAEPAPVNVRLTEVQIRSVIRSLEDDLQAFRREEAVQYYGGPGAADAAWRALDKLYDALGVRRKEEG